MSRASGQVRFADGAVFHKNPYLRSLTHDQNAELTSAVDNASGALKELGY
jgi:hypothetical protein